MDMKQISEDEFPDFMKHNASSKDPIGGSVFALSAEKGAYICIPSLTRTLNSLLD
jgi:hypothetical protein